MKKKTNTGNNTLSVTHIAGIGASAGGLEAITAFIENVPAETGFSFVIIQHLSPDHKSMMVELLGKHTLMNVVQAEEGMPLLPNCIYLLPSKKFMTVKLGKLHLTEKLKSREPNNAIDVFFESLAEEYQEKAIGIVLSGTGSDGTKGLELIKQYGGITAAFDGMPNSAIAANVADLILPPEAMISELIDYLNEPATDKAFHLNANRDEVVLRDVLVLIRKVKGLDFGYYKRPTLYRRLSKRLSELNIYNIKEYLEFLNTHPEEIKIISQEFLINVTSFFRDKEAFDIIRNKVIPGIMRGKTGDNNIVKVWSVACSTGEEAYSLAILFREYMDNHPAEDLNVKIFATDIDKDALEVASRGYYNKADLQGLSQNIINNYFTPEGDGYRVSAALRKMVVFSYHDILKDPPFSRMDLISCRNMLIYIGSVYQKEILQKLHFALNLDGFLFLGPSEEPGIARSALEEIERKWRIYKCVAKTRLGGSDSIFTPLDRKDMSFVLPKAKTKNPLNYLSDLFKETLLAEHSFAGIFIDQNMEIKQAMGNYKNYIDLPASGFNFNLLRLVPPDLGISLSVAIRKAIKDGEPYTARGVIVRQENKVRSITLTVKPYLRQKEYAMQFLFIVLTEQEKKDASPQVANDSNSSSALSRMNELEKELKETRENLHAVIEEVEAANEELQSANEEMHSTNEELQSANEELQSLNEELHTVSAEHQLKIKELMELNDDMNNYFRNNDIGQILIDKNLIVRKFSPAVTKMVNLIDSDVSRPITDITTRFKHLDFVADIRKVMSENRTLEREVSLGESSYLMRIAPYIRQDKSADGVVVNFIDITESKKLQNILETVLNSTPSAISARRAIRNTNNEITDFEYIAANEALENLLKAEKGSLIGKKFNDLIAASANGHFEAFKNVVETGTPSHEEFYDAANDKWFDVILVKMLDGLVTIATDITEKRKTADIIARGYEDLKVTSGMLQSANMQLEQSNLDLLQFASVASHDLKEPLRKIQTYGNFLYARVRDKLAEGELANLTKIIAASDRMQRLIEDVLTLSKLSNRDLMLEKVNLNNVVARIIDDLEIVVSEKKPDIKVGKLPVVNAAQGQMRQLFQNIISNALKFSEQENISIVIEEKKIPEKQAQELQINPENYLCVSIKDNGIGFEEVYKDKIFGIFQRLNGSNFEGTGIGLAICKKIVENHGGFLLAESKLNEGAEFYIILPK
jgi:two-component system CheB/CheR fusion protein